MNNDTLSNEKITISANDFSERENGLVEIVLSNLEQLENTEKYLEEIRAQTAKRIALKLYERGYSIEDITDLVGYGIEDVTNWCCHPRSMA